MNNLMLSESEFRITLEETTSVYIVNVIIHYYSAIDKIERRIHNQENIFSEKQLNNFKSNRSLMKHIKKQCLDSDPKNLLENYSEVVILSALVSLFHDFEANIFYYEEYNIVKKKLFDLSKIRFRHIKTRFAYKEIMNSIKEIEDWYEDNDFKYFDLLQSLINELELNHDINSNDIISFWLKRFNEKEIFYCIANGLMTNPFLINKINQATLIDRNDNLKIKYQNTLYELLGALNKRTDDKFLKGMIYLFKTQLKKFINFPINQNKN